jgi:hypothetical protein
MLHSPIVTREGLKRAHIERRMRMAKNAVHDDGILHPQYRRKFAGTKESRLPAVRKSPSYSDIFKSAKSAHPLDGVRSLPQDRPARAHNACVSSLLTGHPPVSLIQRVVSEELNTPLYELKSASRRAHIVRPRQIAMYLVHVLTLRSLPEIGRRFGGRDHTTVLHAVRKIEGLIESTPHLAETVEDLKQKVTIAFECMGA